VWGDALIALVRSSGICEYIQEWFEGEGDALVAVCRTKRVGDPEPVERRFSWKQAKAAGLTQKKGPWSQGYGARMLQMRNRSWTLRDVYADILKGLAVAEEQRDVPHDRAERAPRGGERKSRGAEIMQRARQAESGQPETVEGTAVEAEDAEEVHGPSPESTDHADAAAGVTKADLMARVDQAETVEDIGAVVTGDDWHALDRVDPEGAQEVRDHAMARQQAMQGDSGASAGEGALPL